MSDIIQLLPDHIANQIAAGEVVQRPASVVKELLENSIDASAERVKLIVKDSGKALIQVIDNGLGMSHIDARMCFERHATSKIRKSEDLFTIQTMGFRGEAMASVAAVAQVELKSKRATDELGVLLQIEGSELKKQEPVATPTGTAIAVKNLFFNVPARRNFLKSNAVEMRHIVDEFQRIALSHPNITFSLHQNDIEMYQLPAGKLSKRIVDLFGKKYQDQMAACEEETELLRVYGYVGKPDFAKKTRGEQFFFVNNRYIKSNYLNHAVMTAFEHLLPESSYPFYTLFIEIDPKHIDINVHPTKTEIKFDDERTVYAIIRAAVKQALGAHNISPSLDFNQDVNFSRFDGKPSPSADRAYGQFKNVERSTPGRWEQLYEGLRNELYQEEKAHRQDALPRPEDELQTITLSSMASAQQPEDKTVGITRNYFQIHTKYIAVQVKSGLMLIHQQAAHERILYEKFKDQLHNRTGASQQTLFPQTLTLQPSDFSLFQEIQDELRAIGFEFSALGNHCLVINGIPADLKAINEKQLFESFMEQFKLNRSELSISSDENVARAIAKRSALKVGQRLTIEEMSATVDQLFACQMPNYSPDGTRTTFILELEKIDQFFK